MCFCLSLFYQYIITLLIDSFEVLDLYVHICFCTQSEQSVYTFLLPSACHHTYSKLYDYVTCTFSYFC